ncbi:MAG: ABC transporter permease subunit [Nitriliruptorales bacterium]|nr:ABC transporter permease subunit [Nitriliruptorales bacterium]
MTGRRVVTGVAGLCLGLVVWELSARTQDTQLFLPTVTAMGAAFWRALGTGEFWAAYGQTLVPFLYGWLLAVAVGVVAGLVIGRLVVMDKLSKPYVAFLNALPVSTLVPLVVITLGIGIAARTAVVFLFAVVEVLLTTAAGAREISRDLSEMARSFQATAWRRFRRVILPGALPGILAGIRVGSARAVVGMVVMELLLVPVGVGLLLLRYKDTFRSAELYALVVSLAIFGLALQGLLRWMERRILSYRPEPWGEE